MADSNTLNTTSAPPTGWRVRQYRDGDKVKIAHVDRVQAPTRDQVTLRSIPARLSEEAPPSAQRYEEVVYSDRTVPADVRKRGSDGLFKSKDGWPGSEVRDLVNSGQLQNRINLTIVGDGYTADEKEKFFTDASRIKDDLFATSTFKSYLALFNVHAVFVPSNQSGLTDGDKVKDTALGLYRDPPGSKRGIMPGNTDVIDRAVQLAPATDYPILMANDDYYGGLGGEYAITTRSERSGAMVLRHELGHNFGGVGEEYDGGEAYMGANHSDTADVPWKAWVGGDLQVYDAKALVGAYPWQNLKDGPQKFEFDVPPRTDGQKPCIRIDGSFVGWETDHDVQMQIDGQQVALTADQTDDRGFFTVGTCNDIPSGHHQLVVSENVHDGDNVLANLRVTEYEPGYDFSRDKVEAYPTFDDGNNFVGYRPTHESCLMRDMTSTEFCAIDKENMWHNFLQRLSLIDGVDVSTASRDGSTGQRSVQLRTPALDGLDIRWFKANADGSQTEVTDLHGVQRWNPTDDDHGKYSVQVTFSTPEVRVYNDRFRAQQDVQL